jgi:hypothetical protein
MQLQLFPKKIVDDFGPVLGGATAPRWVRADDGLSYIVKDESPGVMCVRASEFMWLSLARYVALPAPSPEIILNSSGRLLFGTRREQSAAAAAIVELLAGKVNRGGVHLSRIYAFDIFAGNWDRHPGNYLVLNDGGGALAVFANRFQSCNQPSRFSGTGSRPADASSVRNAYQLSAGRAALWAGRRGGDRNHRSLGTVANLGD